MLAQSLDAVVPHWARDVWSRFREGRRSDASRRVWVVARDYSEKRGLDAIRKEAEAVYVGLRNRKGLTVRFASLETRRERASFEDGVWYLPLGSAREHLARWRPDMLHVFESGLNFFFGADLSGFKTIFHSAGLDPLYDLSHDQIDEVVHLSDHDQLCVIVHAEASADRLRATGIRNSLQRFPLVEFPAAFVPSSRPDRPRDGRVVGFASLPFDEEHLQARGFGVMLDLAKRRHDLRIRLTNRSPALAPSLDRAIQAAGVNNVQVTTARVLMEEFYRDLDIYILPFSSELHTHGFPFSVVEAALCGVPVVVSSRSGIAAFVERHGIGVVRDPTPQAFADGCDAITSQWRRFREACEGLRGGIAPLEERLDEVLRWHHRLEGPSVPSLRAWDAAVHKRGGVFVRTAGEIRDHYRRQGTVARYTGERFSTFPHDEDARQEIAAVRDIVMARRGRGRTPEQFRILDLGSGNGRIVCGLKPEGFRVAVDASHPMLVELGARGDAVNPIQASLLTGALPFRPEIFDVVTSFRLIRHLSFPARSAIYRTIAELLRPGGVFIFDCPDRASEIAIRKIQGWGQYPIYDVFWSEDAIDQEMGASPMVVVEKRGIGRAALHGIRGALGERPVRWVVVCRKP